MSPTAPTKRKTANRAGDALRPPPTRTKPVLRFAPSPNGPLHLGHALSATVGHSMARASGGRFLLRIEDIDLARTRQSHVDAILGDLAWLGLTWDGPVLRQSSRFAAYADASARLDALGLLYRCNATRAEIAAHTAAVGHPLDPDGAPLFPASLRRTAADVGRAPFALRFHMERAIAAAHAALGGAALTYNEIGLDGAIESRPARPQQWGDAIIVRKDTPASYHLAVVVDDAFQGVSHVTRGSDLREATGLHRLLQVLLGLPEPLYHHHRLILGPDGRKLSKSAGDAGFGALRAAGASPADVLAAIAGRVPVLA